MLRLSSLNFFFRASFIGPVLILLPSLSSCAFAAAAAFALSSASFSFLSSFSIFLVSSRAISLAFSAFCFANWTMFLLRSSASLICVSSWSLRALGGLFFLNWVRCFLALSVLLLLMEAKMDLNSLPLSMVGFWVSVLILVISGLMILRFFSMGSLKYGLVGSHFAFL